MRLWNRLLIGTILVISTAPLYAQRQEQNIAKLKADARNVVGIIGSDKIKTQTYCQILGLTAQRLSRKKTARKRGRCPRRWIKYRNNSAPNLPR
jgi:hypothetical protein